MATAEPVGWLSSIDTFFVNHRAFCLTSLAAGAVFEAFVAQALYQRNPDTWNTTALSVSWSEALLLVVMAMVALWGACQGFVATPLGGF
jgi:hypothetical protein